jgi:hypothetical protein
LEVPEEVPAPPNITVVIKELIMKQEIKQAGVVLNPGAKAKDFKVEQTFNEAAQSPDLEELALRLKALHEALQLEPSAPEKPAAMKAVAAAEEEAKKGNRKRTLDLLADAGKWTFDVATKIGEDVVAAAIKTAMGIN